MNVKTIGREYGVLLLLGVLGIPIGAAIGAVDVLFGRVLLAVSAVRAAHVMPLLLFLAPIGMAIVWAYAKYGGISGQWHVPCVRGRTRKRKQYPASVGSVCHGQYMADASVRRQCGQGRRAVQLGAALSHSFGKRLEAYIPDAARIFLITGMAAGFSGLFQTPIAATLFAIEVLSVGSLALSALIPAVTASFTACWVSSALGLEKFSVDVSAKLSMDLPLLGKLAVLGVLFGLTGGAFAWGLRQAKAQAARALPQPLVRIAVMGVCLSALLLLLHAGRYCGLGTNLISACFSGETVYSYDWLLKLALTIGTLAAGLSGRRGDAAVFHRCDDGRAAVGDSRLAGAADRCAGICGSVWQRDQYHAGTCAHRRRSVWHVEFAILFHRVRHLVCLQPQCVHLHEAVCYTILTAQENFLHEPKTAHCEMIQKTGEKSPVFLHFSGCSHQFFTCVWCIVTDST